MTEWVTPQDWFWEGNVQSAVIQHLVTQGYKIMSVADTASHQAGKDSRMTPTPLRTLLNLYLLLLIR